MKFTTTNKSPIKGMTVMITNNDEPENDLMTTQLPSKKVLANGLKHSWKPKGEQFSKYKSRCINSDDNPFADTWEKKETQKNTTKSVKEVEKYMKMQRAELKRKANEHRRKKQEKKKENELRGSKVQIIKNTQKLKKWSLKAKRQLIKMPEETVQRLYGKM